MDRPNILFFFTDDQRFDTIGALGNELIQTPNMDWLVENGTAFSNAYILGGTDVAVCMPSRAVLMTGKNLFHLMDAGETIPDDHIMLGETLKSHGYKCWGAGKWHNGTLSYSRNFDDGSDIYFGGGYDHWMVPVHKFDPSGEYPGRIIRNMTPIHDFQPNGTYADRVTMYRQPPPVEEKVADHMHVGQHSSELFAEQAARFLLDYESDDPFFAYIAFMAPHDPRIMPQEFLDMYEPAELEIGDNFMEMHPFDNGQLTIRDELLAAIPRKEIEVRQHLAEYYAMISHVDDQIGKVIYALRESGKLDETIIVFAGDNGLSLGRHGLMGKQNLYEHSIHIPMVMAGPGVPRGQVNKANVYTLDIYPTLCALTGITPPMGLMGKSLVPVLSGDAETPRDYFYYAYKELMRAVNVNGEKLIEYNIRGQRHTQLFNLNFDHMETNDISDDPMHLPDVQRLRLKMLEAREEYGDYLPPFDSFWEGF